MAVAIPGSLTLVPLHLAMEELLSELKLLFRTASVEQFAVAKQFQCVPRNTILNIFIE